MLASDYFELDHFLQRISRFQVYFVHQPFHFIFYPQYHYFILLVFYFFADKSCWPSMKTLFLLRLWSMIFPCSDFRHVVMTPAILLMCEYLTRCPIISGRDVAIGSFLCSMLLSVSTFINFKQMKYMQEGLNLIIIRVL